MPSPTGLIENSQVLDARQFEIAIRRLANSLGYGNDRSPFVGSGIDYVQSRLYQPGDSVRSIDWRITARTGKPHVKEYESTRRIPLCLLIDTSASMMVSSAERTKYQTAVFIAGGVALAALDHMNPVGMLTVGERDLRSPPSLSQAKVHGWLHQLRRYRHGEQTRLSPALAQLTTSLPEKSLIVVLSDLHDVDAVKMLRRVSAVHDLIVLQLRDPASRPLQGTGFLRAREAETGRAFIAHSKTNAISMDDDLRRSGIDSLLIDVDMPYLARLRNFLMTRSQVGRRTR